jgi:hypothetical protein
MRRTIIALLLLLNSAVVAATQPAPAKPSLPKPTAAKQASAKQAPAQNGDCVGVMSQVGDKFTVKKVGYTVFENEENKVPVESWHIDDLVAAKISLLLGKQTAVLRIPYKKDVFASLDTPKLFRDREAEFGEIVRTITAGTRCARYVVVTGGGSSYGTSNQSLVGLGIVAGKKPFFTGVLYNLYTLIVVRVYDGETFTQLTHKAASIGQPTFLAMIHGPHREVDESFWPVSPDVAAQNVKLRDAIRELVAQSLDATLPELKLTE